MADASDSGTRFDLEEAAFVGVKRELAANAGLFSTGGLLSARSPTLPPPPPALGCSGPRRWRSAGLERIRLLAPRQVAA